MAEAIKMFVWRLLVCVLALVVLVLIGRCAASPTAYAAEANEADAAWQAAYGTMPDAEKVRGDAEAQP